MVADAQNFRPSWNTGKQLIPCNLPTAPAGCSTMSEKQVDPRRSANAEHMGRAGER
jgi:hypothetical protein